MINKRGVKRTLMHVNFWTQNEHDAYVSIVRQHGKDYNRLVDAIETKTRDQIYNYATHLIQTFKTN